ncbi:MAG: tRNA (adenosine(37)-N6)-threonylcarbamoyltransferase complex transferase subunit TsaD [Candidatus Staskawiczbacteria bacterium]|nr:tRNA (adenosine(37)-N6)-threonylcarbamoyltransferase complex transferase subunit TsaD [Candidatus Staskawiczbacteria bacterium]
MKILAIETSCDDTGIAILEADKAGNLSVLANIVASQIKIHKKYGGVFPAMAKREHQRNLVPVLTYALKQAKLQNPKSEIRNKKQIQNSKSEILNTILEREPELLKKLILFLKKYTKPDVDLIAVTNGPGLEPCLWVGVNFARALSYIWNIPIVPVNHIEGHVLVNFLNKLISNPRHNSRDSVFSDNTKNLFPAICLVVSGGHTQLILMKGIGKYKILGETRDDAAGECFDKCAKILGLPYPGGPAIAKLADSAPSTIQLDSTRGTIQLPRPMINTPDYDFSFSGLKTAVLYKWRDLNKKDLPALLRKALQAGMSAEVQQAIIDVLLKKTIKAVKDYKAKTLILGGGVSANQELKKQFQQAISQHLTVVEVLTPPANLSTDNALMIAITAYFHKNKTIAWQKLKTYTNLRISK